MGPKDKHKQLEFVYLLKNHSVLLNKSQLPAIRVDKEAAAESLIDAIESVGGSRLTKEALHKKINNMRTAVKKKAGFKNKAKLLPWETEFQKLVMEALAEDKKRALGLGSRDREPRVSMPPEPVLTYDQTVRPLTREPPMPGMVPGGISVGVGFHICPSEPDERSLEDLTGDILEDPDELSVSATEISSQGPSNAVPGIPPAPETAKRKSVFDDILRSSAETEETLLMSNSDLERLLLLEKLKLVKLQQKKAELELKTFAATRHF